MSGPKRRGTDRDCDHRWNEPTTYEGLERAAARLRQRSIQELADFIAGLLTEHGSGVGDYARAFAAPDCETAARIIENSIDGWSHFRRHDTYHQAKTAARHLQWTLDAIERCVLPHDPRSAFRLLVRFFERDDELGQDDLEAISEAFRRAAGLFRKAANACPPDRVQAERERLVAHDRAGYRAWLTQESA